MFRQILQSSVSIIPWKWRGAIRKIPLVAALQRRVLAMFLEGREFVHTVDAGPARGLRYPITLPDDKGIWTGTYELDFASTIRDAVRPGCVCYDCGGWRGFFSGVMALAGASHVYAFEPLPANVAQLRKMLALNPDLPITLIEAAVTEQSGSLEFVVMPETSMGKLASSSFQAETRSGARISVRAVSLDDLLASGGVQPPAVMKIDVEGAELMLLRGAKRVLALHRPELFMEIHSRQLRVDCCALLESSGYEVQIVEQPGREICHLRAVPRR